MTPGIHQHKLRDWTFYEGYILVYPNIRYYTGIIRFSREDALADLQYNPTNLKPAKLHR